MTRRRRKPSLAPTGRYDLQGATMPPGEALGEPTTVRQRYSRVAAIPDPYDPNRRLLASVNIRTDILEDEYAHGRISQSAHYAGRAIQNLLEQTTRTGTGNQWNSGDRVDATVRKEEQVERHFEMARKIQAHFAWMRRVLGEFDCKIIRHVLGDAMSYGACAALYGKTGNRGVRYIAARFRDALEALANEQAAKGREL